MTAGDVLGDGFDELIVADDGKGRVDIHDTSTGDAMSFSTRVGDDVFAFDSAGDDLTTGNIVGDGKDEIIVGDVDLDLIIVYWTTGKELHQAPRTGLLASATSAISATASCAGSPTPAARRADRPPAGTGHATGAGLGTPVELSGRASAEDFLTRSSDSCSVARTDREGGDGHDAASRPPEHHAHAPGGFHRDRPWRRPLTGVAPVMAAEYPVGHGVQRIVVPGTAQGEPRQVDVHLWYPADPATVAARPKAVYSSALHGVPARPGDVRPAVVDGRGRDRARGRGDRPGRQAVPGDRVLPRQHQRPDRLRAHAGADRRRRVRRRRAVARQQHAGRRADRLLQRAGRRRA